MQPRSLQRAWKMKPWMRLLSGLTLKPSIQNLGVDAWILSLQDIRASHFPSPEPNVRKKTRATSGRSYGKSSEPSNPGSASSKTSLTIYDWDLNKSTMTYDQWVTALRRVCLQRKKSVRRIAASASSSWLTPRANESSERQETFLKRHGDRTDKAHGSLTSQVKAWPTPTARDWKDSPGMKDRETGQISLPNMAFRSGHQHQDVMSNGGMSQMRLNPLFTEWLMGWPIGWTDFAPVGTVWCHWWQRMHSELFTLLSMSDSSDENTAHH